MRYSGKEDDAGFIPYVFLRSEGKILRFFVDDKEYKEVITADDEEGFIEILELTESGKPILNKDEEFHEKGEYKVTRITGNVRIVIGDYVNGHNPKNRNVK